MSQSSDVTSVTITNTSIMSFVTKIVTKATTVITDIVDTTTTNDDPTTFSTLTTTTSSSPTDIDPNTTPTPTHHPLTPTRTTTPRRPNTTAEQIYISAASLGILLSIIFILILTGLAIHHYLTKRRDLKAAREVMDAFSAVHGLPPGGGGGGGHVGGIGAPPPSLDGGDSLRRAITHVTDEGSVYWPDLPRAAEEGNVVFAGNGGAGQGLGQQQQQQQAAGGAGEAYELQELALRREHTRENRPSYDRLSGEVPRREMGNGV